MNRQNFATNGWVLSNRSEISILRPFPCDLRGDLLKMVSIHQTMKPIALRPFFTPNLFFRTLDFNYYYCYAHTVVTYKKWFVCILYFLCSLLGKEKK